MLGYPFEKILENTKPLIFCYTHKVREHKLKIFRMNDIDMMIVTAVYENYYALKSFLLSLQNGSCNKY